MRSRTVFTAAGLIGLAALTAVAVAQPQQAYTPGPQNVELPADWQTRFVRYAVSDSVRRKLVSNIYINPESLRRAARRRALALWHDVGDRRAGRER